MRLVHEPEKLYSQLKSFDHPRVGIATCIRRDGKVLVHKRKGNHAPNFWAFPGGHLEKYETFERTALREIAEETGPDLKITNIRHWTTANVFFKSEDKHYVVVFMIADWVSGEAVVMEPEKCHCWEWHEWHKLPQPFLGFETISHLDPTEF